MHQLSDCGIQQFYCFAQKRKSSATCGEYQYFVSIVHSFFLRIRSIILLYIYKKQRKNTFGYILVLPLSKSKLTFIHLIFALGASHSCLYCFSSSNLIDEDQFSEFWTRDDGGSGSEDDISDADGIYLTRFCNELLVMLFVLRTLRVALYLC